MPDRRARLETFAEAYGLTSADGLVDEVIHQQRWIRERVRQLAAAGVRLPPRCGRRRAGARTATWTGSTPGSGGVWRTGACSSPDASEVGEDLSDRVPQDGGVQAVEFLLGLFDQVLEPVERDVARAVRAGDPLQALARVHDPAHGRPF